MANRLGWALDGDGWRAQVQWFSFRQLKLDGQSQKEERKVALNAALGGKWFEARAHSAFQVGDLCVLPTALQTPPSNCVRLHHATCVKVWVLSGPTIQIDTVAIPTSAVVRSATDIGERVWLPLLGFRQSVFRAELVAVVTRSPHRVMSDCKGRHQDLEEHALLALTPHSKLHWVKAHQTQPP
eukprot:6455391-Amphidinium_carterae.1